MLTIHWHCLFAGWIEAIPNKKMRKKEVFPILCFFLLLGSHGVSTEGSAEGNSASAKGVGSKHNSVGKGDIGGGHVAPPSSSTVTPRTQPAAVLEKDISLKCALFYVCTRRSTSSKEAGIKTKSKKAGHARCGSGDGKKGDHEVDGNSSIDAQPENVGPVPASEPASAELSSTSPDFISDMDATNNADQVGITTAVRVDESFEGIAESFINAAKPRNQDQQKDALQKANQSVANLQKMIDGFGDILSAKLPFRALMNGRKKDQN